ncbi:MAG: tetratricopeptide repeat protein [Granulosicoccus sp.]
MFKDLRDHVISTESATAAQALSHCIELFAQRHADTGPQLQSTLEADPDCVLAQALLGLMLHGARTVAFRGAIQLALEKAQRGSASVTKREKLYVTALKYAVAGRLEDSVRCYEAILEQHPTDLLAHVLLQSELFWLGEMVWCERVSKPLEKFWTKELPGYPAFLAIRAFDLEETNQFAAAESVARNALAINPGDVWGAHALAHVMLMQNRIDEGIAWMGEHQHHWEDANQMQFHLAWHQCLFLGERRAHDEILNIYDTRIRNSDHALYQAMPDLYIDLQNASSLLWRLENTGVEVGDRWEELAEHTTERTDDMSNAFTSAHFAMILAAAEQFDRCDYMIRSMEAFAQDASHDLASRYEKAALPAARAAVAHRRGDHQRVVNELGPARLELWRMGGSHAQQDVFHQLLADSLLTLGDASKHASLLGEIEQIGFVEPARRVAYSAQR